MILLPMNIIKSKTNNVITFSIFLLLGYGYDEKSVQKLEKFIQDAEQLIDSEDVFWLSIQSNVTADVAGTDESFNTQLQKLIQEYTMAKMHH